MEKASFQELMKSDISYLMQVQYNISESKIFSLLIKQNAKLASDFPSIRSFDRLSIIINFIEKERHQSSLSGFLRNLLSLQ